MKKMKKVKKTLPMKGVHIPRVLLFLLGFIHGRLHTAQLEGGVIVSAFIVGQSRRFRMACVVRRLQATQTLHEKWKNADQLLLQLPEVKEGESSMKAREREKAEARRHTILTELSTIRSQIWKETQEADDQMESTAHALASCFAAYSHGVLMKPISPKNLPEVSYEKYSAIVLKEDTWNKLDKILKEEMER